MKRINNKLTVSFVFVGLVFFFTFTYARAEALEAFKKLADIQVPNLNTPSVLEIELPDTVKAPLAVYSVDENTFVPSLIINKNKKNNLIFLSSSANDGENAFDGDYSSAAHFDTDGFTMRRSEIIFEIEPESTVDSVILHLPKNVSLPEYVLVYDLSNAKVLLARTKLRSRVIKFPQTKTKQLATRFEHIQPLAISEVTIQGPSESDGRLLRFLARPGLKYKLYFNAEYYPSVKYPEAPNLSDNKDIKKAELTNFVDNPLFKEADSDKDGIPDKFDNCVNIPNKDQKDLNENGRGDVCDDFDKDGVINSKDNCPDVPNRYQKDTDHDGIGDVCDKEESRFTEKYPWLIWLSMGAVALLFVFMTLVMLKNKQKESADTDKLNDRVD